MVVLLIGQRSLQVELIAGTKMKLRNLLAEMLLVKLLELRLSLVKTQLQVRLVKVMSSRLLREMMSLAVIRVMRLVMVRSIANSGRVSRSSFLLDCVSIHASLETLAESAASALVASALVYGTSTVV